MENIKKLNWSWHQIRVPPGNLQYFSQNFEERKDVVYCHLNEIEPIFLAKNEAETEEEDEIILDPRNGAVIENVIIYSGKSNLIPNIKILFPNFPTKSSLSREIHKACLRVLNGKQHKSQLYADDLKKYDSTSEARSAEYKLFNDFVKDYFSANFKEFYDVGKEICQQYQRYLSELATIFRERSDEHFTLQTALPSLYDSQNIFSQLHSKILYSDGFVAVLEGKPNGVFNLKDIPQNLFEKYLQNLRNLCLFNAEDKYTEYEENSDVILPEETLSLLLKTLSRDSNAWDIPLTIKEKSLEDAFAENNKFITFNKPFPKRKFTLQDAASSYNSLFDYHIKLSKKFDWLNLSDGTIQSKTIQNSKNDEIFAVDLNQTYKISPICKYLQALHHLVDNKVEPKNNIILIGWSLESKNCHLKPLKILTKRNLSLCIKKGDEFKLLNTSLKLEYKKQFGAEVIAKSELIIEWIKQSLIPQSYTQRVRLDAKTLEPILLQRLTKNDIEEELQRLYNINPLEVLTSLHGFLTTLFNLPAGEYLLRYDSKQSHQNQVMVYSKSLQHTETALSMHELLKDTGIIQATETEFTPIDSTVVTPMHGYYSVLPACFPPWGAKKKIGFNDQTNILKRVTKQEKEKEKKEALKKQLRKSAKNRKKKINAVKRKIEKQIARANETDNFLLMDEEGFHAMDAENLRNNCDVVEEPQTSTLELAYEPVNFDQYLAEANASLLSEEE